MNVTCKAGIIPFIFAFAFLLVLATACGITTAFAMTMSPHHVMHVPGTTLLTYQQGAPVRDAVWSPDGKQIASVDNGGVLKKWDATSGKTLWQTTITYGYTLTWSHNGKFIAVGTASDDSPTSPILGAVEILNAGSGKVQQTLTEGGSINVVAWSADDKSIVAGSDDGSLHIWNSSTGQTEAIIHRNAGAIQALALSHNGNLIAFAANDSGHYIIYTYNIRTGEEHPYVFLSQAVTSLSWSANDQYIASASEANAVQVWNASTFKKLYTITDFSDPVSSVVYSHDGKQLAVADDDKTSRIYDANTGKLLVKYTAQSAFVYDAQWSPNDRTIASASADFTVKIWQAR